MKNYIYLFLLVLATSHAKGQETLTAKQIVNYIGKTVTLFDSVYSAGGMDNISLLNIGGKFPGRF